MTPYGSQPEQRFLVGVLSVGSEIVSGDQVDTNAAWLAGRIRESGGTDVLHVAVDDDHDRIVAALRWLAGRTDGVVVGGGLGPTSDDRTRPAVAEATGLPLERRPDLVAAVRARFDSFGARMPEANLQQADAPAGAVTYPPVGTAPGFRVDLGSTPVWVLPGVPWEQRALFEDHVAADLRERAGGQVTRTRVVHVTGSGESSIAERLIQVERSAEEAGVDLGYLATGHEVLVKLTASAATVEEVDARTAPLVDAVVAALGDDVAGLDDTTGERAALDALRRRNLTVAVAESATAGMVAARLADVPGAGDALLGGVVVYATGLKTELAGVPVALLRDHPPVSEAVTGALAEGVRTRLGADVGLATTGVAGPTEQDGVAVGQCWWAVATPSGTTVRGRVIPGDRNAVRGRLATAAIDLLRRSL